MKMKIKLLEQYLKQGLRILLFALSVLSTSKGFAYSFQVDGLCYNINGSEATVTYRTTSYNSYSGNVTIPSTVTYNGRTYSVTSIGSYAFYKCTGLTSVTIPESVTSICKAAFHDCTGLVAVNIVDLAAWCRIAFEYYDISYSYNTSNPLRYAHHLYLNGSEIINLTIPESVASISSYSFYGCSSLASVNIPNSVTSIGGSAFYDCVGLTSVTIPNSITTIGTYAFSGCI